MLVARQAETDQRTFYAGDTHEMFHDAGLYRMLVPASRGGLDLDLDSFHQVIVEICSGCPSTGWQLCLGAVHTLAVQALFGDAALEELFDGADFICASTVAPQGVARQQADASWIVSGVFNYASGIPYAQWFLGHALTVLPDGAIGPMMTFIAPRSEWNWLDDWGSGLGLKGSGSHSVELVDARVPARFAREHCDIMNIANGGAPHEPLSPGGGIVRQARLQSQLMLAPAAMLVGMLKGGGREYERLGNAKSTLRPPITRRSENEDHRRWLGVALGKLTFAEAALSGLSRRWTQAVRRAATGEAPFAAEEDLAIVAAAIEIMQPVWSAMSETLWPTAGTAAAAEGAVLQRIYRDMSMARSHALNIYADSLRRDLGREAFQRAWQERDRSAPAIG